MAQSQPYDIEFLIPGYSAFVKMEKPIVKEKVIVNKKVNCKGFGSKYCKENGEHSWFNHAMDSYYTNNESNLPPGFIEDAN